MHRDAALPLPRPFDLGALVAPLSVLAFAVAWSAAHGIDHRFISFSDGVYLYAASVAAAHGAHALYGEVALSLPPGSVLGAALVWKVSPHVESVRLALGVLGALTSLLSYRVARMLFGLGRVAAVAATAVAIAGPLHNQFVGLDGDAFLTPLVLVLALALARDRFAIVAMVLGLGFFFKLTWAVFALAALVVVARKEGRGAALRVGAGGLAVAVAVYGAAVAAWGWSAHDLVTQLVVAESRSGYQLDAAGSLAVGLLVLWWPLLVLAPAGLARAKRDANPLLLAGAVSMLFMLKRGTVYNVLDPLEPLLASAAVAGAIVLWQRGRPAVRAAVAVCVLALALHGASVTGSGAKQALPPPIGVAIVSTDNEHVVDRVAAAIDAHTPPGRPALVNPLFALVAHRPEPLQAADWFILHALPDGKWRRVKALARDGRVPVVGVDENVGHFDPSFSRETGVTSRRGVLRVNDDPIRMTLYALP